MESNKKVLIVLPDSDEEYGRKMSTDKEARLKEEAVMAHAKKIKKDTVEIKKKIKKEDVQMKKIEAGAKKFAIIRNIAGTDADRHKQIFIAYAERRHGP